MTSSAAELRPVTLVAIGAVERALELARRRVGAADITAKEGRDLVTATDRHGVVRLDARKCWEAGAFCASSWVFLYITMTNHLSEWFFTGYMAAWVGARFLRDREKRLNAIGETKGAGL